MPPRIENVADCEIHAVIRFLNTEGVKAIEIPLEISHSDNLITKFALS